MNEDLKTDTGYLERTTATEITPLESNNNKSLMHDDLHEQKKTYL